MVFLRHLPSVLSFNWRRRGFLVDYRSFAVFERSVTLIFGGFLHALVAYPVPSTFYLSARGLHAPTVAVLGALLLAVAIGVPLFGAVRRKAVTPAVPAALTLVVALVLAAADRVPFGDGRTDEVLYPALLVCLASVATRVVTKINRATGQPRARRAVLRAVAVVALAGAMVVGFSNEATYPTIGLRGVAPHLDPRVRPGDVIFVDTFNSFGWCYYGLSPCATKVGGVPVWPQGFRPVSSRPGRVHRPALRDPAARVHRRTGESEADLVRRVRLGDLRRRLESGSLRPAGEDLLYGPTRQGRLGPRDRAHFGRLRDPRLRPAVRPTRHEVAVASHPWGQCEVPAWATVVYYK